MRTKTEVINFLNSKVGTTVPDKLNSNLNGQCVTLEKALLEFLGVSNPYAARGNAKDYATNLVSQGIATNGKGWLNVVVNPTMGVVGNNVYGHIWNDIDGQNWEQNGAKALVVTKNTRPAIQGRQWVNLDKWVKGDNMATLANAADIESIYQRLLGRSGKNDPGAQGRVGKDLRQMYYEVEGSGEAKAYRDKIAADKALVTALKTQVDELSTRPPKAELEAALAAVKTAQDKAEAANKALEEERAKASEDTKLLDEGKGAFNWLTKLINRLKG